MRNKDKWKQSHYKWDKKKRLMGTHMHKIIGYAYEKQISKHCTGLLADIGCGDVPYYEIYKPLVVDNICIDWSAREDVVNHLDYTADLNTVLPLPEKYVDTVLCTDVLEHIKHPHFLFKEMSRILKSEGKIILTVPFLYWIHDAPFDYHRYTRYALEQYCLDNGLQVVSLDEYGGLPEIIYDLVYKGYIFYNFPLRRLFLFCWRHLGTFLYRRTFVKKLTASSKQTFPLGYILVAQKIAT